MAVRDETTDHLASVLPFPGKHYLLMETDCHSNLCPLREYHSSVRALHHNRVWRKSFLMGGTQDLFSTIVSRTTAHKMCPLAVRSLFYNLKALVAN